MVANLFRGHWLFTGLSNQKYHVSGRARSKFWVVLVATVPGSNIT